MTTLVRRPTRTLARPWTGLDRVFGDFFLDPFNWLPTVTLTPRETTRTPQIDVYETETEVVVKAELPGVTKEELEVVAEDGHLRLRGQTRRDEEVKEEGYYRRERLWGQFERLVHLPAEVDEEHITAKFENGVLEVRAPKQEPQPKGTRIAVQ